MNGRVDERRQPSVALLIETSNAFSRELLRGIRDWMRDMGPWTIHFSEFGRGGRPPAWLQRWRGDGLVARIESREIWEAAQRTGAPVVNVSATDLPIPYPTVISASAKIATLAARHLLDRGLRSFGYCGDARFSWSQRHGFHFESAIRRAGHPCASFPSRVSDSKDWARERRKLKSWLERLPKPAGVMTCYDIRGQQVLEVCREIGLRSPEDVAVIGQHNDEVLCDLCDPPLTSVIPGARNAGYEAASTLDRMMRGEPVAPEVVEIDPIGIATRLSTDTIAVEDPHLRKAIQHIRNHYREPINVAELVEISGLSRTLLERRFRARFGVSPYEHILATRLTEADRLIQSTSMPIASIADHLGFSSPEYFNAVYKRRRGEAPGHSRRARRRKPDD